MEEIDYQVYTKQLCQWAAADPQVLGLVALGSMAAPERRDQFSDHDFFLVVAGGAEEQYRQQVQWLPDAATILFHFRETQHGLKVLYHNGHLCEFAVFNAAELSAHAQANIFAVMVDKCDISARMAQIEQASHPEPVTPQRDLLHVLSLLQVGSGRYARGEVLSGHVFIKSYALFHLLRLLSTLLSSADSQLDNLDPFRRFERVFPALAATLQAALLTDPLDCAEAFLELIEREVQPHLAGFPAPAVNVIRDHIAKVRGVLA